MKIALIGYGKMGQMVEKIALKQGHSITEEAKADVLIEFTCPENAVENVRKLAPLKKPIVVGTTGWYDDLEEVRSLVQKHQIGLLYGPNFSIGIQIMKNILAQTGKIMNNFTQYDVAEIDLHHSEKKDSPSGTALELANILKKNMPRLNDVPISSLRCGSIPGTHTFLFDSKYDTISITHEARSREGFAEGALFAANWLLKKQGIYTFSECMEEALRWRK